MLENMKKKYPDAIVGEDRYVDYDDEFEVYGIFGLSSGHCYRQFYTELQARKDLLEWEVSTGRTPTTELISKRSKKRSPR